MALQLGALNPVFRSAGVAEGQRFIRVNALLTILIALGIVVFIMQFFR